MAYSDPQSVTINAVPVSLPRTGSSTDSGTFTASDQKYSLLIRHTLGTRYRHNVSLKFTNIVPNPLVPSANTTIESTVNFTVDHPRNGMSADEVVKLAQGLSAWLTVGNLTKLIGSEN